MAIVLNPAISREMDLSNLQNVLKFMRNEELAQFMIENADRICAPVKQEALDQQVEEISSPIEEISSPNSSSESELAASPRRNSDPIDVDAKGKKEESSSPSLPSKASPDSPVTPVSDKGKEVDPLGFAKEENKPLVKRLLGLRIHIHTLDKSKKAAANEYLEAEALFKSLFGEALQSDPAFCTNFFELTSTLSQKQVVVPHGDYKLEALKRIVDSKNGAAEIPFATSGFDFQGKERYFADIAKQLIEQRKPLLEGGPNADSARKAYEALFIKADHGFTRLFVEIKSREQMNPKPDQDAALAALQKILNQFSGGREVFV